VVQNSNTKRRMASTADILSVTRAQANALVENAERSTGSRTAAYERVAQTIGVSPSWLVKFLRGERSFPTVAFNIVAQYEKLCSRVELEAEVERKKALALREQFHAANPGIDRLVQSVAGTSALGTKAEGEAE
jgi:hypothetical protein